MTAFLLSLLASGWQYIAGGLVALVGLWAARNSGKNAERAKQLTRDAKARDTADEIDDAVAGRTATENRKRLSKWASK